MIVISFFRLGVIQIAMIFKGSKTVVTLTEWRMILNIQYLHNYIS